jgi:hypothetical protein
MIDGVQSCGNSVEHGKTGATTKDEGYTKDSREENSQGSRHPSVVGWIAR